jgi:hypothetical protein
MTIVIINCIIIVIDIDTANVEVMMTINMIMNPHHKWKKIRIVPRTVNAQTIRHLTRD